MKKMKYIVISLLAMGCKEVTNINTETPRYVITSEMCEGRYYYPNGGMLEVFNDFNNQVGSLATTLIFNNSNGSLATFSFPALSKVDVLSGIVRSQFNTLSGASANAFIGNVANTAANGTQLSAAGTYRYQTIINCYTMDVSIDIQQLVSGSYVSVFQQTLGDL